MNAKEIVKKYLEENGYDGLFNWYGECGCKKDYLFPCESCPAYCEAGYLIDPPEQYKDEVDYWIGPKKGRMT
jgi:hypothetical protein